MSAAPAHSIICCLAYSMARTEKFGISVFKRQLARRYIARRGGGRAKNEIGRIIQANGSTRYPTILGSRRDLREGPRIDQNGLAD